MRNMNQLPLTAAIVTAVTLIAGVSVCANAAGADAGKTCGNDKNCFDDQFADCKPAQFTSEKLGDSQLRYRIIGHRDDQCAVQMRFLAHPKPAWVDKPLTMVLDSGQPLGPQLKDAVGQCLSNAAPMDYQCSGPLRGARTWGPARTGDGPVPEAEASGAGAHSKLETVTEPPSSIQTAMPVVNHEGQRNDIP